MTRRSAELIRPPSDALAKPKRVLGLFAILGLVGLGACRTELTESRAVVQRQERPRVHYAAGRSFLAPVAAPPAKVMTFNIRFANPMDGLDAWALRKHRVMAVLRKHEPHILMLQEAFPEQVADILREFPRFAAQGAHRLDGRIHGEGMITLYDRGRYLLTESGAFWLSDTPDRVGSTTWGNGWPRACAWARLVDLASGDGLFAFNVHLDHRAKESRRKGSVLMRKRILELTGRYATRDPAVLGGDFNAHPESEPMRILLDSTAGGLLDAHHQLHPEDERGTYTGFDLKSTGGDRRIDYLLVTPDLRVLDCVADRSLVDGRWPSDHLPVIATIQRTTSVPIEGAALR